MARGQEYSRYQRGVIQRRYEHADTIALQKLSEIVSDLYLAEGNAAGRLWKSAEAALKNLAGQDDARVRTVLATRDAQELARLITELSATARAVARDNPAAADADMDMDEALSPVIVAATSAPSLSGSSAKPHEPSPATPIAASAGGPPTPEQLKAAMKAFRKRLKLTRLDDESKLGRVGNPMSGGKKSQVVAIMPPREYPKSVWDELVNQGKLKASGGSFYELVEGA